MGTKFDIETPPEPTLHLTPIAVDQKTMALMLGVSDKTFREWCKAGDVPTFRRGNVVRYPVEAVKTWMIANAKGQNE